MRRYDTEIKLMVSDIDGTLLNSENDINPLTEKAVRGMIKGKRCKFTFSTGRAFPMTLPMAAYLELEEPFIYSSCAIYDLRNNRSIFAPVIKPMQIKKITRIAKAFDVGIIAHTEKGMFCQVNDNDWETIVSLEWMRGKKVNHAKRVGEIETGVPVGTMRIDIFTEVNWLEEIWQEVKETIPNIHAVKMRRSIEISHEGMHKGSALTKISQLLNIPLEHIMAVGDSMNDIHLLQEAGYGVAMGTAPAALKDIADAVVPSADDNGLVKAFEIIQKI